MESNRVFFLILIGVLLLGGCTNSLATEEEFLKWLNEPKNGLVKKTSANGFVLTLKYLPPEYLLYTERKKETGTHSQIPPEEFNESMTFILSIQHQSHGIDATNYGIQSMAEYKNRIAQLNFDMKKYLFVKDENGKKTSPVLIAFENAYEIGGKKSFYVVFSKKAGGENETGTMDIVFEDPFLDTGINHFVFKKSALTQIPKLEFTN